MCGILGAVNLGERKESSDHFDRMLDKLRHRGPNARGTVYYDLDSCTVALGHTRLSVIDLTEDAAQPMHLEQLTIVYNGEIYNYQEIQKSLEKLGHRFNSHSDTEVVLRAFYEWGPSCVERFLGMFAFAILDRQARVLHFGRDRAGVKPLYYYYKDELFLFASELKAFHEHPDFRKEIDFTSVEVFLDYGYIPSPACIFKNCKKLESGYLAQLKLPDGAFKKEKYWSIYSAYQQPKHKVDYQEAKSTVDELLSSACGYRMIADVPVGVFLSGGYDSTAVAAILQQSSSNSIRTFTIGFEEGNNEAQYAKATAQHLGTEHREYYCSVTDMLKIVPKLPEIYDEPFADSSAIPTSLICSLAVAEVTVALSADGGDEVFAGYNRYQSFLQYGQKLKVVPSILRKPLGKLLHSTSKLMRTSAATLSHRMRAAGLALKSESGHQAATLYNAAIELPFKYKNGLRDWDNWTSGKLDEKDHNLGDELSWFLAQDYDQYLENDIMVKVDRASMFSSLEAREPLLDHRLVEYVARLPSNYKYDGFFLKRILKDIVHNYVPKRMMDRPKTGFSVPLRAWLQGDLAALVDSHLNSEVINATGVFRAKGVQDILNRFRGGDAYLAPLVWKLLMFQMWYQRWMS